MNAAPAARRTYLDVLRGVAVLIMIEAHVIDSWTRPSDRSLRAFGESLILGGFGAPLFLFLAGIGVAMSAGSKARRLGDTWQASLAVQKRGLQIFALALLFRFQSYVLSHAPAWTMLKVDILNIMGLTMIAAAALWALAPGVRGRIVVFSIATGLLVFVTPGVRNLPALGALPDWVEAYLRPVPGMTNFTFFPWAAFLTGGAILGVMLDAARTDAADRRVNVAFGLAGIVTAVAAYQASFLPPLHPRSSYWTTSASFFFLRLGLMMIALAVAWLWEQRPAAGRRWSPLQTMGQSSLFIYWVHVELVYGLVAYPVKGTFSLWGSWVALGVFCLLMLWLTVWKDKIVRKYRGKSDLRPKLDRRVQALMF